MPHHEAGGAPGMRWIVPVGACLPVPVSPQLSYVAIKSVLDLIIQLGTIRTHHMCHVDLVFEDEPAIAVWKKKKKN